MMGLPKEIIDLIERFDRNLESYKSGQYNEAQLRQDFLNPFFCALGWDMSNKAGYAEAYRDVIHEDAIKIGGATKAPDYCFRIGSNKRFFVEAKKPSVNLKDDASPAFQLRRYAWSAKLPLSILTDFEEFAVYDCRIKPIQTDKASIGRVMYFTYNDYPSKWDTLASIFSREAVLKGSFDKYAESSNLKKGTSTVDDEFLTEIEDWRNLLARNIAIRNPDLSQRELNFAVQRTIDRIVFLRICEDRGIEEYGKLQVHLNGTNVYKRLVQLFSQADDRYNSGLFHFEREKDRHEEPDKLTPNISIDDKPLKDIINRLYYPESPYEFSVLSVDILGQVYEQFLGKVIRLTVGHQAKVEEKPEVRKAGGVYYTPKYLVDYIVKNTVGMLVENKKPKDVGKLRILDPACGSGSFLLGVYQYLLDWHLKWYIDNEPEKWAKGKQPTIYQGPSPDPRTPNWNLTTAEKKRILLNNIYGVDIDSQAVEVTKLSLLLKVLEGENSQTLANQLRMFHERALPDLGDNIKCGNSLIGSDFYRQQTMLDDEDRYHVNIFDWEKEFPEIMKAGGFDAVIGNPPWGASLLNEEKSFYARSYSSFAGNHEIYLFFIDKAIELLRNNGFCSYVTPDSWIKVPQANKLRRLVLERTSPVSMTTLPQRVFNKVSANCIIFVLAKNQSAKLTVINIMAPKAPLANLVEGKFDDNYTVNATPWKSTIDNQFQIYQKDEIAAIIKRIKSSCIEAVNFLDVMQGIVPYSIENHSKEIIEKRAFHASKKLSNEYDIWIQGRAITRYNFTTQDSEYLRYGDWLHRPRKPKYFEGPRMLIQEITGGHPPRIAACFCDTVLYHDPGIISCLIIGNLHTNYLLGIINSTFLSWYHRVSSPKGTRHAFPKVLIGDIRNFPIPKITMNSSSDSDHHDKIVALVDQMLLLNRRLTEIKTDHERTAVRRQIHATDQQIDQLVYALYGLTQKEIRVVEASQ
jgi:type I restriction-modification system DNA methylase subunit